MFFEDVSMKFVINMNIYIEFASLSLTSGSIFLMSEAPFSSYKFYLYLLHELKLKLLKVEYVIN